MSWGAEHLYCVRKVHVVLFMCFRKNPRPPCSLSRSLQEPRAGGNARCAHALCSPGRQSSLLGQGSNGGIGGLIWGMVCLSGGVVYPVSPLF